MNEPRWWSLAKAPWGLVGMVGLLVLIEGAVARRSLDLLDIDDWAYRKSLKAIQTAKRYDVLCFGDSMVKCGLVARGVEERSGLRVLNLAVSGSQAPSSYALLKRALDQGAKPEAVIVEFQPPLLRLNPRHNLGRWANILSFAQTAWVAYAGSDPSFFGVVAVGKILPSYHSRQGVRDNVLGALTGKGDARRFNNFMGFRNWGRNDGTHLLPVTPSLKTYSDADAEYWRKGYFPKWECHPANLAGLEAFLDLAAQHKLKVYWLLPPQLPIVQEKMESSGMHAAYSSFVKSYQSRYPNLAVLDGRGTVADAGAYFDPNHLAAGGTYAFSLAVGDALRQARAGHMPPDRWLHTAHVRPLPLPEGFEDTVQTQTALTAGEKSAR